MMWEIVIKLIGNKWTWIVLAYVALLGICGVLYLENEHKTNLIAEQKNKYEAIIADKNNQITSRDNIIANLKLQMDQCNLMVKNQKGLDSSMKKINEQSESIKQDIKDLKDSKIQPTSEVKKNEQSKDEPKNPAKVANTIIDLYNSRL